MLIDLLLKVVKGLDNNHIPYIIIGGQAVNLHGTVRATQDIDITFDIFDVRNIILKTVSSIKSMF